MHYLECGKVKIPLCYVQSIAFSKKARVVRRKGGYVRFLGFEPVEISIRASFDVGVAQANDRNLLDDYITFESLVTERMDTPATCTVGGYPLIPEIQFALISVNKSRIYDTAFDPTVECDIALAGVRISKEVSRSRIMDFTDEQAVNQVPKVTLSCEGKSLELSGGYALQEFKVTTDSCRIIVAISDDLAIAKQPSFLEPLIRKEGTFSVAFDTGTVKYWVADASLQDNILSITGTIFPPESQKTYLKTYWNVNLSEILNDLCERMKINNSNKFMDFSVDYFQSRGTPMTAIQQLCDSAGLIMAWWGNDLTFAEPPRFVAPKVELEAIATPNDTGMELYKAIDWRDNLHRVTVGNLDENTLHIQSSFRTESEQPANNCFSLATQRQRIAIIESAIVPEIIQGSAVRVNSNGTMLNSYISDYELDYLSGYGRYETCIV